jgi:hypothetical protein
MDWMDFLAMEQVSLWDGIIPSKEHAKFWIHTTNKYRFTDQVSLLSEKCLPLFLFFLALYTYRTELACLTSTH